MIQLYTWNTPNGKKVSIMVEEVGIPYEVYPINLQQGDQHKPDYLAINPNNKIPSIVDTDGPGGIHDTGNLVIRVDRQKIGRAHV